VSKSTVLTTPIAATNPHTTGPESTVSDNTQSRATSVKEIAPASATEAFVLPLRSRVWAIASSTRIKPPKPMSTPAMTRQVSTPRRYPAVWQATNRHRIRSGP
jgi:hypothetical protein